MLDDFLHRPHSGRGQDKTVGIKMDNHVFDHLAQICLQLFRIITVDSRNQIGTLADVGPIFFAPFDPLVVLVALFHS
jgi:hypothetical protein